MQPEITFIRQVFIFAVVAAVLYCVPVYAYIKHMSYEESYILYVGNFLFAAVIGVFIAWFYKKHETSISTIRLVIIGGKAAFAGIAVACVFTFILLLVLVPEVFKTASDIQPALQGAPGQFAGKNDGFGKILFLNAVLGNAGASFFISLLIPFSVMKNIYPGESRNSRAGTEENPKKNYHL